MQVAPGSNLQNEILFKIVLCPLPVQLVDFILWPVALYFPEVGLIFLPL